MAKDKVPASATKATSKGIKRKKTGERSSPRKKTNVGRKQEIPHTVSKAPSSPRPHSSKTGNTGIPKIAKTPVYTGMLPRPFPVMSNSEPPPVKRMVSPEFAIQSEAMKTSQLFPESTKMATAKRRVLYRPETSPISPFQMGSGVPIHRGYSGRTLDNPLIFWRWLIEQVPRTIAPNAITLVGLIFNILGAVILMLYDPTATQDAPAWVYLFAAFTLFLYQSLDAIDGKQARRTNSSSPLGELFDHGCDAVSINFVSISVGIALQLGTYPNVFIGLVLVSMFMFYTAHWQTYVCGSLKFGKLDVTEGQITFCCIFIASGVFGPGFWSLKLPILGIEFKILAFIFGLVTTSLAFYNYVMTIFGGGGKGKNGSTVADTSVLSPLFHITAIIVMATVIKFKSPSRIFENSPCLYLLMFGMVGSKVTNKLVVAHMSKSGMKFLDSSFIGPGLLFINQYLDAPISEYWVLWIALIYSTFDLARYATVVCTQICEHLNIYCFDIVNKRPISEPTSSSKNRHDSTS